MHLHPIHLLDKNLLSFKTNMKTHCPAARANVKPSHSPFRIDLGVHPFILTAFCYPGGAGFVCATKLVGGNSMAICKTLDLQNLFFVKLNARPYLEGIIKHIAKLHILLAR